MSDTKCTLLSGEVKTHIPAEFGAFCVIDRLFQLALGGSENQDLFAGLTPEGIHTWPERRTVEYASTHLGGSQAGAVKSGTSADFMFGRHFDRCCLCAPRLSPVFLKVLLTPPSCWAEKKKVSAFVLLHSISHYYNYRLKIRCWKILHV